MLERILSHVLDVAPPAGAWSLRLVAERSMQLLVRNDVVEPVVEEQSCGAIVTVVAGDGHGWAATSDVSRSGLAAAARRASEVARASAAHAAFPARLLARPQRSGSYRTPVERPFDATPLADHLDRLRRLCRGLDVDRRVVERRAALRTTSLESLLVTCDGIRVEQVVELVEPLLVAVANEGSTTQVRTYAGPNLARQGGLEQLDAIAFDEAPPRVGEEAVALLSAPEVPHARTDVVLMPGQMALQIHETIGHPLELDRILGDERNYAGGSFVTLDMFGTYRYGSELLNVVFDPAVAGEAASYGFDDEGTPAERVYLIRHGILERALGGATSQARAGVSGAACARASGWQRPPIDRMGNLNLEPGDRGLEELIASVERGVLMDTNRSWSVDDRRDKFQFGCEIAWEIRDGRRGRLLRNPGYRGRSATFWRSLAGVGRADTVEVWGPTNCGKGEPNQAIFVGHAAPPCLFRGVEVFGGESLRT